MEDALAERPRLDREQSLLLSAVQKMDGDYLACLGQKRPFPPIEAIEALASFRRANAAFHFVKGTKMERRSDTSFGPFNNESGNGIRRHGAHAFAFGLAFATAALACAGAGAETAERTSIAVPYGDLDVAHEAGTKVLLHRLRVAAGKVCGPAPDIRELTARGDYDRCLDQAVGRAVTKLDMPLLVELYRKPGATMTERWVAK